LPRSTPEEEEEEEEEEDADERGGCRVYCYSYRTVSPFFSVVVHHGGDLIDLVVVV